MSATFTPPPLPPRPAAPTPGDDTPQANGGRAGIIVAILVAVIGGLIVLGTIGSSALTTIFAAQTVEERLTTAVTGVTELDVDASASLVTITFGDVDEAVLDVSGGLAGWALDHDGTALEVRSPQGPILGWWGGSGTAVLTLPADLEGRLDASLALGAGDLRADGAFRDLELELSAGSLTLEGTARTLSVDVGAGRADLRLADVAAIELSLSAGSLVAEFEGDAPDAVSISVSAGSLDATLPRAEYDVRSEVSAGGFNNHLTTSSTSARTVWVEVEAGSATLREAR